MAKYKIPLKTGNENIWFTREDTILNITYFMLEHWGLSTVINEQTFDRLVSVGIPDSVITDWIGSKLPVLASELVWRDEEIDYLNLRHKRGGRGDG